MAHMRKHGNSFHSPGKEEAGSSSSHQLLLASPPLARSSRHNAIAITVGCLITLTVAYRFLAVDINLHSPQQASPGGLSTRKFTVRMNTFRRNAELKRSIDHLSLCPAVAQIQVVWSDQKNKPPDLSFFKARARPLIVFEQHKTDSLNNRFAALLQPATEGIFSVDDDMTFSCSDLVFAFDIWRLAQTSMVGFVPRLVTWEPSSQRHSYRSWWFTWWNGAYNLVLTKACFLHRDYLSSYAKLPPPVLAYIDKHRNCEDLAMSFVVAKESRTAPVWVKGRLKEMASTGKRFSMQNSMLNISIHFMCRECVRVCLRM
jgi:Glycosyl transferase family 64 domain